MESHKNIFKGDLIWNSRQNFSSSWLQCLSASLASIWSPHLWRIWSSLGKNPNIRWFPIIWLKQTPKQSWTHLHEKESNPSNDEIYHRHLGLAGQSNQGSMPLYPSRRIKPEFPASPIFFFPSHFPPFILIQHGFPLEFATVCGWDPFQEFITVPFHTEPDLVSLAFS